MRAAAAAAVLAVSVEARAASALAQSAQEIAKAMTGLPQGSVVVAAPLVSDVPVSKPDELGLRIATVIAGRLPGQARAHDRPLMLPGAHRAAKGSPAVVFVRAEIARGELRVIADAYPVISNSWDRVRLPRPAPAAHAFASAPIDAELRAFMPPIPLEQATLHKAKHEEGEVLAVACGDLDADGNLELALVSRERVTLGRLARSKLHVTRSQPWSAISARAPTPLREPLAGAVMTKGGLFVGITDREPALLDAELRGRASLAGIPVGEGICAKADATSAFSGPLLSCREGSGAIDLGLKRWDAGALASITGTSGVSRGFFVAREPGGRLHAGAVDFEGPRRVEEAKGLEEKGAGAQVALADLDLDGAPELVFSANAEPDALTIAKIDGTPRLKFPAPAGVRAVATCPPEERGAPSVVAIVGDEVWLVR